MRLADPSSSSTTTYHTKYNFLCKFQLTAVALKFNSLLDLMQGLLSMPFSAFVFYKNRHIETEGNLYLTIWCNFSGFVYNTLSRVVSKWLFFCPFSVHFLYTSCTPPVHFMYTFCTLPLNFPSTSCALHVHLLYAFCTLSVHFLYTSCTPAPVHFLCTSCTLPKHFL